MALIGPSYVLRKFVMKTLAAGIENHVWNIPELIGA